MSKEYIRQILNSLGIKYQSIRKQKSIKNENIYPNLKFVYLKRYLYHLKEKYTLVYIDESYFRVTSDKYKVWMNKSQSEYKLPKALYGSLKYDGMSLILSSTNSRIIYYEIAEKKNNQHTFKSFVSKLLETLRENNINRFVLCMDNAPIHCTKLLKNYYTENHILVLFGGNYPLYNLCDNTLFSQIKRMYSKKSLNTK